ncbi:MAG: HEAT repeat domain-containing protein, partial [Planctomycetota bacterium]
MAVGVMEIVSILLAACLTTAPQDPAPPAPPAAKESKETPKAVPAPEQKIDPVAATRETLLSPATEQPARVNAAIDLLASDPGFLGQQLAVCENDDVVLSILDAVQIRVAQHPRSVELVQPLLKLTLARNRGVIAERAVATLKSVDSAWSEQTRPQIVAALTAGDAQGALAAVPVLAVTRDLSVVVPLLDLLETTAGKGPLAQASAEALSEILGVSFGTDVARWREFWDGCAGKSRDRILEETLARTRSEHREQIEGKNREIVRLKREMDANNPAALLADLNHELAGVRTFAAELLLRGPGEWNLEPARPVVIQRLESGEEPEALDVAMLQLLRLVDSKAGRSGPEAQRDGLIVRHLGSKSTAKVVAAVQAAESFPVGQIRDEVLRLLNDLSQRALEEEARVALVEACAEGKLTLKAARDPLVSLVFHDPSARVRRAAVSALGSLKIADTRDDLARALLEDTDWQVRRRAATALGKVSSEPAIEPLVRALDDSKPEVRSEVVTVLSSIPGEAVVTALSNRLIREDVANVRATLVRALGQLGSAAALPALCHAALSVPVENGSAPDPAVAAVGEAARAAIASLAGDDPARWTEVVAQFAGRPGLLQFALPHQLRTLSAQKAAPAQLLQVRVQLARVSLEMGALDQVVAVAGEGVAAPEGLAPALLSELQVLSGRALKAKNDHKGAAAAFDQALAMEGLANRVQVLGSAAEEHQAAGNSPRAMELLGQIEAPTREQLLALARLERAAGKIQEAIGHYRQLVRSPGESETP